MRSSATVDANAGRRESTDLFLPPNSTSRPLCSLSGYPIPPVAISVQVPFLQPFLTLFLSRPFIVKSEVDFLDLVETCALKKTDDRQPAHSRTDSKLKEEIEQRLTFL